MMLKKPMQIKICDGDMWQVYDAHMRLLSNLAQEETFVVEWTKPGKLMSPCCSMVAWLEVNDFPCFFFVFQCVHRA